MVIRRWMPFKNEVKGIYVCSEGRTGIFGGPHRIQLMTSLLSFHCHKNSSEHKEETKTNQVGCICARALTGERQK